MRKPTSIVSSALVAFLAAGSAKSAPITLAFEAEIVRVFDTVPFDAGVSFEVGDTITGRFSFVPDDSRLGSGQLTTFESQQSTRAFIDVNGVEFSTPDGPVGITIRSYNNAFSTLYRTFDSLTVGSLLIASAAGQSPNVSPSRSSFGIILEGDPNILSGAIIPADPESWNDLFGFNRRLAIRLDSDNGGSIGFDALLRPASFVRVPEPSAASLLVWSLAWAWGRRRAVTVGN